MRKPGSWLGLLALSSLALAPIPNLLAQEEAPAASSEGAPTEEASTEKEPLVVEEGRKVSIEYTLTLDDGTTADSNVDKDPLVYQHGAQQILPALEAALTGMAVDDTKKVQLTPEEGYGPVQEAAFQEVDPEMIPENARQKGAMLMAQDPSGGQRPVRVHEVGEEKIVLDFNHPLAGENLNFEVRIVGIE
jgi:FKBP-type peptidyl-prolyl cis-trans isomerase 2